MEMRRVSGCALARSAAELGAEARGTWVDRTCVWHAVGVLVLFSLCRLVQSMAQKAGGGDGGGVHCQHECRFVYPSIACLVLACTLLIKQLSI